VSSKQRRDGYYFCERTILLYSIFLVSSY
jgi:hypothetical protein